MESKSDLCTSAYNHFENGKYQNCYEILQKLDEKSDPVNTLYENNKSITLFYLENTTKPIQLKDSLIKLLPNKIEKYTEDISIILYNISLIEYNLKHYNSALSRLEPLFEKISDFSEFLAVKICFLLLEIYLILGKQHCNIIENANKVFNHLQKFSSLLKKPKKGNVKGTGAGSNNSQNNQNENKTQGPPPVDANEFKYLFHLYKAKYNLFNKLVNQSIREIKNCMSPANQSVHPMFLKSNIEYLKENYDKSGWFNLLILFIYLIFFQFFFQFFTYF